jgi:hypothetical protein
MGMDQNIIIISLVVSIISTAVLAKSRTSLTAQATIILWILTGLLYVLNYVNFGAVLS